MAYTTDLRLLSRVTVAGASSLMSVRAFNGVHGRGEGLNEEFPSILLSVIYDIIQCFPFRNGGIALTLGEEAPTGNSNYHAIDPHTLNPMYCHAVMHAATMRGHCFTTYRPLTATPRTYGTHTFLSSKLWRLALVLCPLLMVSSTSTKAGRLWWLSASFLLASRKQRCFPTTYKCHWLR